MTEVEKLESEISQAAYNYYIGQATMPDSAFDALVDKLKLLSPESPILSTVGWGGGAYLGRFKSRHFGSSVIGSLDKVKFSDDYSSGWGNRTVFTPKLDGSSVVVTYKNGNPIAAITRGDGREGQNILSKISHLIPSQISYTGLLSIRGEVYIGNSAFEELKDAGVPNPRNYAAGILNRDKFNDPDLSYLSFAAYSIVCADSDLLPSRKQAVLSFLARTGFTVPFTEIVLPGDFSKASFLYKEYQEVYPVDGLVATADKINIQFDGTLFNWIEDSIAIKFPGETARTTVTSVIWTTGNSGRVNPVVQFEPVFLEGSTISFATGYNLKFINDFGIRQGTVITVRKANGIIPEIVDSENKGNPSEPAPSHCPSCNAPLQQDGFFLVCPNTLCTSRLKAGIYRFLSVCGIPFGLSEKTIDAYLQSQNFLKIEDILAALSQNRLKDFTGHGEHYSKLLSTLADNIADKLRKGLEHWEFWYILNLPNLGESNSKKIVETPEEVFSTHSLSRSSVPCNARDAILERLDIIADFYRKLTSFAPLSETPQQDTSVINFTYTGKTDKFKTRKEFFNFYKDKAKEVPIAKADYLICNSPSSSSKYQYATKHGIKIISEAEAISLLS